MRSSQRPPGFHPSKEVSKVLNERDEFQGLALFPSLKGSFESLVALNGTTIATVRFHPSKEVSKACAHRAKPVTAEVCPSLKGSFERPAG